LAVCIAVTGIVATIAAAITIASRIAPNNLVTGTVAKVPRLPQTIKTFFKSFEQSYYNMLTY
jgi:microcompartment protein CcmL/EutN